MKRLYILATCVLLAGVAHAGWRDWISGIFAGDVQPPDRSTKVEIVSASATRSSNTVTIVANAQINKRMSNPLALALVVQNSATNPPPYNRKNRDHSTLAVAGYKYRRENDEIHYDYEIPMGISSNSFRFENLAIPESASSIMVHFGELLKRPNHNRGPHNQGPYTYSKPRICSPVVTLKVEDRKQNK